MWRASRGRGQGRDKIALAIVLAASACVSHGAPRGFLTEVDAAGIQAWGGWIDVRVGAPGGGEETLRGELVAASADSLWILTATGGRVVATGAVTQGHLTGYDPDSGEVERGVLLGTVSTISNGIFLVFTAPMWIIGGSVAANSQRKVAREEVSALGWADLVAWARFPQGMPSGLDLDDLEPRSLPAAGRRR